MLLPTFLTTAALALTANAFLIPAEVSDETARAVAKFATALTPQQQQKVSLPCKSCSLASKLPHLNYEWPEEVPSVLELDFARNDHQLLLNHGPFYPSDWKAMVHPIRVLRVPAAGSEEKTVPRDISLSLSYSLEVKSREPVAGFNGHLVTLIFHVIGLEGKPISVDSVKITALEEIGHESITINKIDIVPAEAIPGMENCTTIMCKVKAIIVSKIQAARLAAWKAANQVHRKLSSFKETCLSKLGWKPVRPSHAASHFAEQTQAPQHGHHERHGFRKVLHIVARILKTIFLPILIGVAAGMAASALGMLVGQLVVFLWLRYRRSHISYEQLEQIEEIEGLPKYEDVAPEDAEKKEESV